MKRKFPVIHDFSLIQPLRTFASKKGGTYVKSASSLLNIELKTPSGMLMRVSGEMTGEMLGEVIRNIGGHVQS